MDAGYVGQEEIVKQHKMNPIICEKGYRNRPLTKEQKSDNRKKSKTRCLVEHVFGFEEQTMRGLVVRTVGLIRAKANVALTSLVYNILKSKEQKNIQPTKGGHKMVTCQNYVSLFYRQITSCPSDGGIS